MTASPTFFVVLVVAVEVFAIARELSRSDAGGIKIHLNHPEL